MKISNETKVGALTAIAITILILGFNFLKGTNITERSGKLYSVFPDIQGLQVSNAVFIKGLQVGKISAVQEKDNNLSGIVVTITLLKNINIPDNSLAVINSDLLGSASVEITMGNSANYLKSGDTLRSTTKLGVITEITQSLNPALGNVNKTLESLDRVVLQLQAILDSKTQVNIQNLIASLAATSQSLETLMKAQSAALGSTIRNVEAVTGAFARNSGKIDTTLAGLQEVSSSLASANLGESVKSFSKTMTELEQTLQSINSKKGSIGMLLNDRQLYEEIRLTNRSLTTLLDDLRVNPKRYVNISVFGRKDKSGPILQPIIYDSVSPK